MGMDKQGRCHLILIFFVSWLSSCSSYPDAGKGGLAEYYINMKVAPGKLEQPKTLKFDLEEESKFTQLHLNALIEQGAKWCFPAVLAKSQQQQNRIARELEGGLLTDATHDLVIQRRALNQLKQQLDHVTQKAICIPPNNKEKLNEDIAPIILNKHHKSCSRSINSPVNALNKNGLFSSYSIEIVSQPIGKIKQSHYFLSPPSSLSALVIIHTNAQGHLTYNKVAAPSKSQTNIKLITPYSARLNKSPKNTTVNLKDAIPFLFDTHNEAIYLTSDQMNVGTLSLNNVLGDNNERN